MTQATPKGVRIVFPGKSEVLVEQFEPSEPRDREVLVATRYSLMSTGTEATVLDRRFADGTHWDRWVRYPFHPGYANVGVVVAVGSSVTRLRYGDVVATRRGHVSHFTIDEKRCYPVPPSIPGDLVPWFAIAKIALVGARAARHSLGDDVAVIGAGPIGQMSTRWARAAGAESIVVVDPWQSRLRFAQSGGATATVAAALGNAFDAVREAMGGRDPKIVIDTTGNNEVFGDALRLAGRGGCVVVLGDTGVPSDQRLSSDLIMKGLTIVGAHDSHDDGRWDDETSARLFFSLVTSNRFALEGLNTHYFSPGDAIAAYDLARTDRGETLGIVFVWDKVHS
jgi:2-desacetyl-2-hydroxyethyl bacteriochlorophyllide A dehydrogenase